MLLESGGEAKGNSILYLWTEDIDARVAELEAKGVRFIRPPGPVHKDEDGTFGPAGETEWMAFFEDPGRQHGGFGRAKEVRLERYTTER